MNQFIIRPAAKSDIEALVDLEQRHFTSDAMTRRHFQRALASASVQILVAEDAQTVVGSVVIFFRKRAKYARLYSLVVDANYRKKGIALALCQALEALCRQRACSSIVLEVRPDNPTGIQFHQNNQYEVFGHYSQFYEDGADAIRMRKKLFP